MILILLNKFSESQDSIIGYKLCEKLAEQGLDLLVTSTSKKKEKQAEIQASTRMTKTLTGSARIIEVEPEVLDAPTPERITTFQRTLSSELPDPNAIKAIFGTLPGTAQCAIELKNMIHCQLILLAQMKISTTKENLKAEVRRLASCSDEIWSMGLDVYFHYEEIFQERKKRKHKKKKKIIHKEIMLRPEICTTLPRFSKKGEDVGHVFVSVWSSRFRYRIKDAKKFTKGSSIPAFDAVKAAIERIQKDHQGIQWSIHGLEAKQYITRDELTASNLNICTPGNIPSPHNISWKHCIAYIAPDADDKSFNFLALVALWLGVPTLVSEESSVGIFLSGLTTPLRKKPIVRLKGDVETDKKVWYKKLNQLFRKKANPTHWAKELSEFLRTNDDLWRLDLSVLKYRPVPIVREEDLGFVQYPHRSRKRIGHADFIDEMPDSKKQKPIILFAENSTAQTVTMGRIPSSLLEISQGILEKRFQIVRFVRGFPCTIQGSNSDVLLHVPEGVHGAVLANIHTNHAKFLEHIPHNHCVVSPICEYHLQPNIGLELPTDATYILQVPHIISDVPEVRDKLKIQHINIGRDTLVNQGDLIKNPERYEIDEEYVTIYTSHFCAYIVTAESVNCCSGNANVSLFGDLNVDPETEESEATVKIYFSSIHSEIRDYESDLKQKESSCTMALKCLTNSQMVLSTQPYDFSKSTVNVTLKPRDSEMWQACQDFPLDLNMNLNEALKYIDGHICKHPPTEVGVFHVESSEARKIFRGNVHIKINIVPDDPNNNAQKERLKCIKVDLRDYSFVPKKINVQVPSVVESDLLGKLALEISTQSMKTIGICYFKLKDEDIKNIAASARENTWQLNYDILCKWYNQSADKSRSNLANHLREAQAKGLVDQSVVDFVLGVH